MAYFCLTVLEWSVGGQKKSKRERAAERYGIGIDTLKYVGELSSTRGGQEARKSEGSGQEFTNQERRCLENKVKLMIRKVAETARTTQVTEYVDPVVKQRSIE